DGSVAFLAGLILVYARWWAWYGGWGWGPRFLLYAGVPSALGLAIVLGGAVRGVCGLSFRAGAPDRARRRGHAAEKRRRRGVDGLDGVGRHLRCRVQPVGPRRLPGQWICAGASLLVRAGIFAAGAPARARHAAAGRMAAGVDRALGPRAHRADSLVAGPPTGGGCQRPRDPRHRASARDRRSRRKAPLTPGDWGWC